MLPEKSYSDFIAGRAVPKFRFLITILNTGFATASNRDAVIRGYWSMLCCSLGDQTLNLLPICGQAAIRCLNCEKLHQGRRLRWLIAWMI
jgi:hypothetical protein